MLAYELPDGRLVIPLRAVAEGVIGDGMVAVGEGDPEYREWRDYFAASGGRPVPLDEWPPEGE
jgi:hypothetical protein